MAKAKNIATGTINGSGSNTLTISNLDFKPDHIMLMANNSINTDNYARDIIAVYDNMSLSAFYGSNAAQYLPLASFTFTNDGAVMTGDKYNYSTPSGSRTSTHKFRGTYSYVAWQE